MQFAKYYNFIIWLIINKTIEQKMVVVLGSSRCSGEICGRKGGGKGLEKETQSPDISFA